MEGFKDYLIDSGLSTNTVKNYISDMNVLEGIGIDSSIVKKLKHSSRSASTINRMLSTLRRYGEYRNIDHVKDSDFIKLQPVTSSPDTASRKEVLSFLKTLKDHSYRNYCIAVLMANTGLRISECLNLRLSDLSKLGEGELSIIGKGGKCRLVSLNNSVIKTLDHYLVNERMKYRYACSSEYVFVSNKGIRLDSSTIQKIFKRFSEGRVNPHMLRHFFATNAYECGLLNLRQLQEQLGHSSLTTVQRYTHPSRKAMLESLNRKEGSIL